MGRATVIACLKSLVEKISIHALRGEGDKLADGRGHLYQYFNPRPPWGGRQLQEAYDKAKKAISIHALRGEGDIVKSLNELLNFNFNPRPPWGGRRLLFVANIKYKGTFQSTPSVGRATQSRIAP